MMFCCLCFANGDERNRDVLNAGGMPLCYEHNASVNEQSRRPPAPRVVTLPRTPEEEYVDRCIQSALDGAGFSPLVDPAG
jgi:hypothetical protein